MENQIKFKRCKDPLVHCSECHITTWNLALDRFMLHNKIERSKKELGNFGIEIGIGRIVQLCIPVDMDLCSTTTSKWGILNIFLLMYIFYDEKYSRYFLFICSFQTHQLLCRRTYLFSYFPFFFSWIQNTDCCFQLHVMHKVHQFTSFQLFNCLFQR